MATPNGERLVLRVRPSLRARIMVARAEEAKRLGAPLETIGYQHIGMILLNEALDARGIDRPADDGALEDEDAAQEMAAEVQQGCAGKGAPAAE